MYLLDILKDEKLKVSEKLNHFDLAIRSRVIIPVEVWRAATKKYPNFVEKKYKSIFTEDRYFSNREKLISVVIYDYRNRKTQGYKKQVENFILGTKLDWSNIKYKSCVEEILYANHTSLSILVLSKIKNLDIFDDVKRYKVPATTNNSLKFFKYLNSRGYNYKRNRVENIQWLYNYLKAGGEYTENLILGLLDRLQWDWSEDSEKVAQLEYCVDKMEKSDIFNKYIDENFILFSIDKILVNSRVLPKSKKLVKQFKKYRERIFENTNFFEKKENGLYQFKFYEEYLGLKGMDRSYYYPSFYSKEDCKVAFNNFDSSVVFEDKELILKKNKIKLTRKNGKYNIFEPDLEIKKIYILKQYFKELTEKELDELSPVSDSWSFCNFVTSYFEKLAEHYSVSKIESLVKTWTPEIEFGKNYDEIEHEKRKYGSRNDREFKLPLKAKSLAELDEYCKFYRKNRDRMYSFPSNEEKLIIKRKYKDYSFKSIDDKGYVNLEKMIELGIPVEVLKDIEDNARGRDKDLFYVWVCSESKEDVLMKFNNEKVLDYYGEYVPDIDEKELLKELI